MGFGVLLGAIFVSFVGRQYIAYFCCVTICRGVNVVGFREFRGAYTIYSSGRYAIAFFLVIFGTL